MVGTFLLAVVDWTPVIVAIAAAIPGIAAAIISQIGNNKVDRLHDCVDRIHTKMNGGTPDDSTLEKPR
jgi:hypothetical protein